MKYFGMEPFDSARHQKITWGELRKALSTLGFKRIKSIEGAVEGHYFSLWDDGKHRGAILPDLPDDEYADGLNLAALTFKLTWNGVTKNRIDLAKIVEQIRRQEKKKTVAV